jgi:hypothetical protein
MSLRFVIVVPMLASPIMCASAEVTEFIDFVSWQAAVGSYTTIHFDELGTSGAVTDQYASLGIIFPDGNDGIDLSDNYNDGFGLSSQPPFGPIHFMFDKPQLWIGVDFPGGITFELYAQGSLIYTSENLFQIGGTGNFGGLLSSIGFDDVVVHDFGETVAIDDLHFGVPGPGALPLLALAGMLGTRRRRQ